MLYAMTALIINKEDMDNWTRTEIYMAERLLEHAGDGEVVLVPYKAEGDMMFERVNQVDRLVTFRYMTTVS